MDTAKCKSCGAEIIWAEMRSSGKKNPLDAVATEKGNVHIDAEGKGVTVSGNVRELLLIQGTPLYLSHFATCPNSLSHRKPKGAGE